MVWTVSAILHIRVTTVLIIVTDLLGDLDRLDEDLFGEGGESEEDEDEEMEDVEFGGDAEDDEDEEEQLSDEDGDDDDDQIESEAEMEDFFTDEEAEEPSNGFQEDEEDWGGIQDKTETKSDKPAISVAPTTAETGTSASSRYVPPALRKQQEAAAAAALNEPVQDPRLRRQLLGLLNRLSPTSFPTLVLSPTDPSSLHSIYLAQSRAVVNSILSSLILEIVLSQGDGLGETQAVVLAGLVKLLSTGLVGGMSASGGKEVGASVLDAVVKALDKETTKQEAGEEGKKRLNLIGFLAELYNLQVVAAGLVFDVVKELIGNGLKEGDVEALLRILRQSGPQLRHDDPTALKQIIQLVQEQQKGVGATELK